MLLSHRVLRFTKFVTAHLAYFVLGSLLLVTFFVVSFFEQNEKLLCTKNFEILTQKIEHEINTELNNYETMLTAIRGLYDSSELVTNEEFHTFVNTLTTTNRYDGIQAVSYAPKIKRANLKSFEALHNKSGLRRRFRVWPESTNDEYYPLLHIAPDVESNYEALGFDISSEATRRATLKKSQADNAITYSKNLKLVQEDDTGERPDGFLIVNPLFFKTKSLNHTYPSEPDGFLVVSIKNQIFFKAVFNRLALSKNKFFRFRIYDHEDSSINNTPFYEFNVYEKHPALVGSTQAFMSSTGTIDLHGNKWNYAADIGPRYFEAEGFNFNSIFILGVGTLISFLFFWVLRFARNTALIQLQYSSELEKALRARDSLISVCSHELKTPLTAMTLQAQLLDRKIEKSAGQEFSNNKLRMLSKDWSVQLGKLNKLIDEMLDFSRISAGKMPLSLADMNLSDLVCNVSNALAEHALTQDSRITTQIQPGISGKWDALRIEQVLINLLDNAIKYGKGSLITVSLEQHDTLAILKVSDKGYGIEPSAHESIFKPYEREKSTANIKGLGLGLYISKQIVESHNGSIEVQSELGEGATFIVRLPSALDTEQSAPTIINMDAKQLIF